MNILNHYKTCTDKNDAMASNFFLWMVDVQDLLSARLHGILEAANAPSQASFPRTVCVAAKSQWIASDWVYFIF